MTKTKKLLALLPALALVVASCGSDDDNGDGGGDSVAGHSLKGPGGGPGGGHGRGGKESI